MMSKAKKRIIITLSTLLILYLVLLIPDNKQPYITRPTGEPFTWRQDSLWNELEKEFVLATSSSQAIKDSAINRLMQAEDQLFSALNKDSGGAADSRFDSLLANYFHLASFVAANRKSTDSLLLQYNRLRELVKHRSREWNMNDKMVRNTLYKVLYGMRMATEELLLQADSVSFDATLLVTNEPSSTPSTTIFGTTVNSGDILVSRGGAEVSAFISRGNDYPGNFSHIAFIYVDDKTKQPSLIEAHIEKGVAIASAEEYIGDKKLRCMVLRPRADLPQLKRDPLLPHKAANFALTKALNSHTPYDFKMNFYDSNAMFCSEVASHAYKQNGIRLWQALSTISSKGVIDWLSDFGVENFVTQMPSDLEYDPQLSIVAEWRNPETLMKDHIDNAVMDVLLEEADKGKTIGYNSWQLPFVRIVKGWCVLKNLFGGIGKIPEGMSATRALKNLTFNDIYDKIRVETTAAVAVFVQQNHYKPPYWQLIKLARMAADNNNREL